MVEYEIFFRESVYKDFRKIPKKDLKKILLKIQNLSSNPRPPGSEKLTEQEIFRIPQGNYRILYSIQDNQPQFGLSKLDTEKKSTVK